ncbi:10349_t:CDS:2 [Paraglomus occultum]|uniref:Mitochondrial import inner membrane translocase subunit TIM16 n=1 Tax=Paraglomus occultum TaxID=144539 RepID=A0A9N9A4W3_9GLOM|nr:10349_t:CDS:2 [Paraglomus occultum]
MAARLIAQIIVMGVQIVGRAFIEASKQAAANAARNGSSTGAGSTARVSADALTRKTGMTIDEACQILNIKKEAMEDMAQVAKNYEHLFKVNDKSTGGSFYLQCKVQNAKDRIEAELMERAKKDNKSS